MGLKRQAIVQETLNRLNNYFEKLQVDVDRGKPAASEQDFPIIYIYEDIEEIKPLQRGNLHCTLPIQLDYYFRTYTTPYEDGNNAIVDIKKAMEIDDYFNKIAIRFYPIARHIDIQLEPITKVSVVYNFEYYEFAGVKGTQD